MDNTFKLTDEVKIIKGYFKGHNGYIINIDKYDNTLEVEVIKGEEGIKVRISSEYLEKV